MNKPLFISIAILLFTTVGLSLGTFILHDAEQKEGVAGYVRIAPAIEMPAKENQTVLPVKNAIAIECKDSECELTCTKAVIDSSCHITPSKYLRDTLLVSSIMLSRTKQSSPDLTWMQMEYFSASNGKEMIVAQHDRIGIYLIEKESESEMTFMNFFDRAVEVKFSGESHNGMPDVCATNFDMTLSFYVWDGDSYELDHEERWACPA
jgi:hypothetical protein